MSFNEFQSNIKRLKNKIKYLNKSLVKGNGFIDPSEVDQLRETWLTIENNVSLAHFISYYEYRDLKASTEFAIEDTTVLIREKEQFLGQKSTKKVNNVKDIKEETLLVTHSEKRIKPKKRKKLLLSTLLPALIRLHQNQLQVNHPETI